MKIQRCAICEKNNYKILYPANFKTQDITDSTFSARRLPDKIHYQIVRCKTCNLIYSNPILDLTQIKKLYQRSSYTYAFYEEDLSTTYFYYLQKYLKITPQTEILEVGCGNGFFLNYLYKKGFTHVHGLEPGKKTVDGAPKEIRKKIIVDIFKRNQFKRESIDVICCFQVLDHLPDPNSFLKECYKILKPHGIIFCINHNASSFSAKILKAASPIIDIEHTYLYDPATEQKLFQKHGFQTIHTFDVANRYPFTYWIRMAPLPMFLKSATTKLLNFTSLENIRLWIRPGNFGIVAMKE